MNKFLKIGIFGLSGLTLFAVTFTMVAVFSGAPLHEVAGIGMFVDSPEESEDLADASKGSGGDTDSEAPVEPVSGTEALMKNAGLLTVWSLPSPYTGSELSKLQKELTDQMRENSLEREKLRVRRLELDEWEQTLTDKYSELAEVRTKLEELEGSLDLRQAELLRDENAYADREEQGWKDLAKLFEGGKAEDTAQQIVLEQPADAARILRALDPKQAGEILQAITPPETRKEFMDAYRAAAQAP